MSHYKPYPAYKDSGVEWLGRVPEHWSIVPLKWCFECLDGKRVPLNSEQRADIKGEVPYWGSGGVVDHIEKFIFDESLVLLGEDGAPFFDRDRPVAYAIQGKSWINNHIHVLRPLTDYPITWFVHALNCVEYRHYIDGSTRDKLTQDDMKSIALVIPKSPDEARKAVAHLDRETARIDALKEKKTRFIELLREKRQALITHAVTKGLDPSVKMKDSGVDWLGEVPEHWVVAPMKYVCELLKDGTHLPPPRTDGGVPLLSVRNIIDGHFTLRDDDSTISHQDYVDLCRAFIPQEGDVLLAVVGATLGKTALIPAALGQFHIQRSLAIFRPHYGRMNSYWLHLIFQSGLFQSLLWEHAGYSAQPGIYLGTLAGFSIPQPPLNEQAQIFSYLSERTARLDSVIRTTESSIELLKERRSALIAAVVTGQIDLREAV